MRKIMKKRIWLSNWICFDFSGFAKSRSSKKHLFLIDVDVIQVSGNIELIFG